MRVAGKGVVIEGAAIVILRDNPAWRNSRAYEGTAMLAERHVTLRGRRRRHGEAGTWTWPLHEVKEIRWISR